MKTKLSYFMKNAKTFLVKITLCFILLHVCITFPKAQTNRNCPNQGQLKLKKIETDTITYRAKTIESQQKLKNKSNVKYLANDRITLDTAFSINENVLFKAHITQECGTLEKKVAQERMEILKISEKQLSRFKVLEFAIPKDEENDINDNLPRYNYLINYGDGNYNIFKSQDNFDRIIDYSYNETGTYNVKALRIKLPPKGPDDDDEEERVIDTIVHMVDTIITVDAFEESLSFSTYNRNLIEENVEITFFPEKPISGNLLTVIASFKSEDDVGFSKAKLSFDSDSLLKGNMDIYYCDTEGTESCENDLVVNVIDLEKDKQRNFFSYFTIDSKLGEGDSVRVCLQHQMDSICKFAKIGDPHDPSFKILANIDECIEQDSLNYISGDKCVIDDQLSFFMNIENDGNGKTCGVKIIDYFEPALPCLKVSDVIWEEHTLCKDSYGMTSISDKKDSVTFYFDDLVLSGQGENGVTYDETRDQLAFTFELEQPILDPTYWCNKADIIFEGVDPYTIQTCFYCFGKNYELLNGSIPPTKEFFIDTVKKVRPTFFENNLFTTPDNRTITIIPDLNQLPINIDTIELEYIWWPNQETTPTLTVSPTQNTNYRLRVSWMQNDTICYATDYVFVETHCFYGCTNENALNYDALAQCDDGSCRYCEGESNDTLFTMFEWLDDKVDRENCNAENIKITHYKRQDSFDLVGIEIEGVTNYYRANGNYYDYTEEELYASYSEEQFTICSWECEGEKQTLCEAYPWLLNFYNSNVVGSGPITISGGTTIVINGYFANIIKSYKYYTNNILYIVGEDGNGIVYIDFDPDSDPPSAVPYYTDEGDEQAIISLINDGYAIQSQKSWECQTINCP